MRFEIEWLRNALDDKAMEETLAHYMVKDRTMVATDGRIMAGCPCDIDNEFLVPGVELAAIMKRLPNEPQVSLQNGKLHLRSGRFHGTVNTLPAEQWRFPVLESDIEWRAFPRGLIPVLADLRGFIGDRQVQKFITGLAIDDGWCYSSNNHVFAGAPFEPCRGIHALLPFWVVDFILTRQEGLEQWAMAENFMAFKWSNSAWMRSTLIDSQFPEKACAMVRTVPLCTQPVNEDYRATMSRITDLADWDGAIAVYADRVEARTNKTFISESLISEVPAPSLFSLWGTQYLASVMAVATSWSPSKWPQTTPFHGERIRGYIAPLRG